MSRAMWPCCLLFACSVDRLEQTRWREPNQSLSNQSNAEIAACITDTPGWADYLVVIEGAWEFNEQLEKDAIEFLQPWNEDKKE